uniref:MARVEL domain-containing protein n=1 Tax=Homalodisca liturata TaxID=320908 RepID=A0A1B6HZR4_9HEMI
MFKTFKKIFLTLWLKLIVLCLTVTCLVFWQTEDEKSYYRLPTKNAMELNIYFFTIPAYVIVLSGLILLYFLGETPDIITQRVLLIVGFSLFTLSGTIGVINSIDFSFSPYIKAVALLCCVTAFILVLEYLRLEHFFKVKADPNTKEDAKSKESLPKEEIHAETT